MWIGRTSRTLFIAGVVAVVSGLLTALTPASSAGAATYAEQVLYRFCSQTNCVDGKNPAAALIMDAGGNLYGTTSAGGNQNSACSANGCGTVFELSPTGSGWTEKVLYRFCSQSNCADGVQPLAGVVMDGVGNLYGTTFFGGRATGVSFELMPSGSSWTEKLLHAFGSTASDGEFPQAKLIIDGAGNLYGTTFNGGGSGFCASYCGAVFELSPTGSTWSENTLHGFDSGYGAFPAGGVIMDGAGHLYGTTSGGGGGAYGVCYFDGGNYSCGVAYQLVFTGTSWAYTVLHTFCSQSNCADGAEPRADLIMDGAGNLYGTTYQGGNSSNAGVVFALGSSNALSVSVAGSPGGRVTSSPAGIDCGSTCSASFAPGTQVTLTASPATAWGFSGWGGGACSGIGSCSVTMNANTSVSASFTTLFTAAQSPLATSPADIPVLPSVIGPLPQ
jgi:uncharacterized repeat protein (TIGR03803 family)